MATFVESLWNSIFIPGPTPPLLIATNAAFGALQLLFLALLFATYSVHFVVLSFLCGGLWWGINWFAGEVRAVQAEKDARTQREGKRGLKSTDESADEDAEVEAETGDSGEDTELETNDSKVKRTRNLRIPTNDLTGSTASLDGLEETTPTVTTISGNASSATWNTGAAARLAPAGVENAIRRRRESGELSTDSEWEKVEGDR